MEDGLSRWVKRKNHHNSFIMIIMTLIMVIICREGRNGLSRWSNLYQIVIFYHEKCRCYHSSSSSSSWWSQSLTSWSAVAAFIQLFINWKSHGDVWNDFSQSFVRYIQMRKILENSQPETEMFGKSPDIWSSSLRPIYISGEYLANILYLWYLVHIQIYIGCPEKG